MDTSPPPTSRRPWARATLFVLAVPMGLLASGALVWQSSYAAFTAQTTNPGNAWTAGTVRLTDDPNSGGAAMFAATNLKPGSSGQRCIALSYDGSLAAAVELYVKPGDLTGDAVFAENLNLTVTQGTGSGMADTDCSAFTQLGGALYAGTLSGFATTHTDYPTGAGDWAPTGPGQVRTYRFQWELDAAAPDTAQGTGAAATFTWEARNT